MKWRRSIKLQIFYFYSCLIVVITLLICYLIFTYFAQSIRVRESENLMGSLTSISNQIDLHFQEMNSISSSVVYYDTVTGLVDVSPKEWDPSKQNEYFNIVRSVNTFLLVLGYQFRDIYRIGVATDQGVLFSNQFMSETNPLIKEHLYDLELRKEVNNKNGSIYVRAPHLDSWNIQSPEMVYSVLRLLKIFDKPVGYIEIQKKYSDLEEIVHAGTLSNSQTFIIDKEGHVIYPANSSLLKSSSFFVEWFQGEAKSLNRESQPITVKNEITQSQNILVYKSMKYADWNVISVMPEASFLKPLYQFRNWIITIGLIGILFAFLFSYMIAGFIYKPLREIRNKFRQFDYNKLEMPNDNLSNDVFSRADNEIMFVNNFFDKMLLRLKSSVDELVETRSQRIKAMYLALTAQMNPHFLHNTLSVISSMAKMRKTDEIPDVVDKLSTMLRYSMTIDEESVPLAQEFENVASYLGIMKYRYKHRLQFALSLDNIEDLLVPKQILQPLVENAIVHGLKGGVPSIFVNVSGYRTANGWEIEIKDDGAGFDHVKLAELRSTIDQFSKRPDITSLHNRELGLFNTYTRLFLLFNKTFYFKIVSDSSGGTTFHFGENNN